MSRIVVGSRNPVKVQAALLGFRRAFPARPWEAEGIEVPSGVSVQPMTDAETLQGARNRALAARRQQPDADFWVGIEGGVEQQNGVLLAFAWVGVLGRERAGESRTAAFVVPEEVARLVRAGTELGHADDEVFGRSNSKQQNGSVGLLTNDLIDRTNYYEHAVVLALIPFMHPGLTFPSGVQAWELGTLVNPSGKGTLDERE